MTSRETGGLLAVGLVAILAAVALVMGAFGGTSETGTLSAVPRPPADGTSGVVNGKHASSGSSFAGLTLRSPTYEIYVSVIASRDCVWIDGDGEKLRSTGECADVPVIGPIVGGGRTSEGNDIFQVRVEVVGRCYDAVALGDRWPTGLAECQ